jgi:lysophospholipase L1-like esterase
MSIAASFIPKRLLAVRRAMRIHGSHAAKLDRGPTAVRKQGAIPWGVAGMIGLILSVECFVSRHWIDFSDPVSLSWRWSAEAAETEARRGELLCLGDSLVKHGLVPAVIERATGRRAVNLSAARAPTLWTYYLLRRALDAGARPSAIVINAKPAVLMGGPVYDARYWQEVLTLRDGFELLQMTRKAPFIASTLVGRLLPSLRSRLEVRSNVLAALRGETDRLHAINRVLWRNWTANGGANLASADSPFQGEVALEVAQRLHTDRFHVDRTNATAIERLLRLAAERQIPVFWLMCPLSPNLQALRDESGSEGQYEQFVRTIQARYPQLMTVLDARRAAYSSTYFVDATHLNSKGAIALSRSVAAAIGALLPRPGLPAGRGWIALEPPTEGPALFEGTLEDLETSRRILELDTTAPASAR